MRKVLYLVCVNLAACVEPYNFDLGEAASILVIDAQLTNEVKAHQVKLSWTLGFDDEEKNMESGASVWLMDDQEVKTVFEETEAGIYQSASSFAGVAGRSYILHVLTADGNEYRSTPEMQLKTVSIDSIYGRYLEMASTEDDTFIKGVQILLDAHDDESEFSNFRYEYIEDYEIQVPYPYLFDWDYETQTSAPNRVNVRTCYVKDVLSTELLSATTHGLMSNRLSEFPITMLKDADPHLRHQYSIKVRQYHISTSTYQYYKDLKENNESAGSFSDKQKGTVAGNLINVKDKDSPVLGYFEVAGVSNSYRMFRPVDFESQGFTPVEFFDFYDDCRVGKVAINLASSDGLPFIMNRDLRIFFMGQDIATGEVRIVVLPARCSDCRVHGELEKPKFWN